MEQLLGLIDDPRSELEKAKDYQFEEIYSFGKLNWDKTIDSCPVYSVRDQDGSSSCVAQSAAKALEVILGQVMSAHPIYRRRSNFPNQGMWLQDCGVIIRKLGTTTENLDPSQKLSEAEMNKDVLVDTPILGFNYAFCSDIDQIAQAIESYKQCFQVPQHHVWGTWKQESITKGAEATTCRDCERAVKRLLQKQ